MYLFITDFYFHFFFNREKFHRGNAVVFLQGRAFIIAEPLPCPVRLIDLFRKILIVKLHRRVSA